MCNLASVALNKFVKCEAGAPPVYDHQGLFQVVAQMTRNLNRVIDVNYYPLDEARNSNLR